MEKSNWKKGNTCGEIFKKGYGKKGKMRKGETGGNRNLEAWKWGKR